MLDAQPSLGLLAPWLSVHELCCVRAVNHRCREILPLHAWALVADPLKHADMLPYMRSAFPHARQVALRLATVLSPTLTYEFARFAQWRLTSLELSQVWNLNDANLRLVTESCPLLERLTVRQCYLLKTPAIIGPRLKFFCEENCLTTRFHDDTTWPHLLEMHVSSHVLTTLNARHLLKVLLAPTQIRVLDLSNCFLVDQILIDPGELPSLRTLSVRSCLGLSRVHIASTSIESIDLALCEALEVVVVDLHRVRHLDLSYLLRLSHVFIRSHSLDLLDLRACSILTKANLRIQCPSVTRAHLEGTGLTLDDLRCEEPTDRER